jgi:U3 small nucleolar ribonucleoprotein protein IMP4
MIRKQARERRDYLYRRALTLRDAELASKRASLKASLASGKPLNREVAADENLRQDYKYDESRADRTAEEELGLDDEYAQLSGVVDPRILVTTSRDPSSRLGTFAKEIRLLLPTAIRLNRGNLILGNLISSAQSSGLSDIVLVHEHRGTPTALTVSHLPHGPTASFSLHNVVLRADIPNSARGTVSESYPHLIFEGFSTKLGQRVVQILKHLFPPREGTAKVGNRVVTYVLLHLDLIWRVTNEGTASRTSKTPSKSGTTFSSRRATKPSSSQKSDRAWPCGYSRSGQERWRTRRAMWSGISTNIPGQAGRRSTCEEGRSKCKMQAKLARARRYPISCLYLSIS